MVVRLFVQFSVEMQDTDFNDINLSILIMALTLAMLFMNYDLYSG